MSEHKIKEYSNDEITVVWKADLCVHSANCVRGLPDVFNTNARPWINVNAATPKTIMQIIDKCPSGALTYKTESGENAASAPEVKISVLENGPLIIDGNFSIVGSDGKTFERKNKAALCRCGISKNKPFCDGSHTDIHFEG